MRWVVCHESERNMRTRKQLLLLVFVIAYGGGLLTWNGFEPRLVLAASACGGSQDQGNCGGGALSNQTGNNPGVGGGTGGSGGGTGGTGGSGGGTGGSSGGTGGSSGGTGHGGGGGHGNGGDGHGGGNGNGKH